MKKNKGNKIKITSVVLAIILLVFNSIFIGEAVSANTEKILKVYGTTTMTYSEFYKNEITGEAKNEDGYYDAVTSATQKKLGIIPSILNNNDVFNIDGIKIVDVVITSEVLEDLGINSNEISIIKSELGKKNIDVTYFEYSNLKVLDSEGIVSDDGVQVYKAKPLNSDGSYGSRILINEDAATKVVNAEASMTYGGTYGDYQFNLTLSDYDDNYKDSIYTVTITNEETNEVFGTVWYEDCWPSTKNGFQLQVALNMTSKTIKGNEVVAGRFNGFGAGVYTVTVMARGYKDLVASNIQVNQKVVPSPTLVSNTFSELDNDIVLEMDVTNVDSKYISKLSNATYKLAMGRTEVDPLFTKITASNNGKTIKVSNIKELVNTYGLGNYSIKIEVDEYATESLSFIIKSSLTQPSLLIDGKIYGNNEIPEVLKGEGINIVDSEGEFISGYGASVSIYLNEEVISTRGENAIKIINYDKEGKALSILTDNDYFQAGNEYTLKLISTAYETFEYKFKVVNEKTKVEEPDENKSINEEGEIGEAIEDKLVDNTSTTLESSNKLSSNAVKTGDSSVIPYLVLAVASCGVIKKRK